MLKKELEIKLNDYEEILFEIGKWVNPIQYTIDETTKHKTLLFHLRGIRNTLNDKFYNRED